MKIAKLITLLLATTVFALQSNAGPVKIVKMGGLIEETTEQGSDGCTTVHHITCGRNQEEICFSATINEGAQILNPPVLKEGKQETNIRIQLQSGMGERLTGLLKFYSEDVIPSARSGLLIRHQFVLQNCQQ